MIVNKHIDECSGNHSCSNGAQCINNVPGYNCTCSTGTRLDNNGRSCINCSVGTWGHNCNMSCACSTGAEYCNSVVGCVCKPGFNGTFCELDIDQCDSLNCSPSTNQTCVNRLGPDSCECRSGFQNVSGHCQDINECSDDMLNTCSHNCINIDGSYNCSCYEGFDVTDFDKCQDIDECALKRPSCEHYCTNTIGNYRRHIDNSSPNNHDINYGNPNNHDINYGNPNNHDINYGNPNNHDINYGNPNNHDINYGNPNNHDINYGNLNNHNINYGNPNNHINYGNPNNHINYGNPNNHNINYRNPNNHNINYGNPNNHNINYGNPNNHNINYGNPNNHNINYGNPNNHNINFRNPNNHNINYGNPNNHNINYGNPNNHNINYGNPNNHNISYGNPNNHNINYGNPNNHNISYGNPNNHNINHGNPNNHNINYGNLNNHNINYRNPNNHNISYGNPNNHNINYGNPNNHDINYGNPNNHDINYGNPNNHDINYGNPNNHDINYGNPNNHDINYGNLNNHNINYGNPNNHINYGNPNNHINYGNPNNHNINYRNPNNHNINYGNPNNHNINYGNPNNHNINYGNPNNHNINYGNPNNHNINFRNPNNHNINYGNPNNHNINYGNPNNHNINYGNPNNHNISYGNPNNHNINYGNPNNHNISYGNPNNHNINHGNPNNHNINYGNLNNHNINYRNPNNHNISYGNPNNHNINYGNPNSHNINYGNPNNHNINYVNPNNHNISYGNPNNYNINDKNPNYHDYNNFCDNIDLNDSNSSKYTQLREAFESLINSSLKENMTDLHSVKVVQMRHGSLIVDVSLVLWKIPDEEYIKKVYDGLVHLSEKKNITVLNKSVEVISVIIQDKEKQMTRNISVKFLYDVSNIDLNDSSSHNYTQLREAFESLISSSLKETMTDLHSVKVVQMRHGSLIVVASLVLWKIPDEEYIKKVYDGLVHLSGKKNITVLNKSVEVISVIIQDKESMLKNETSTTEQMTRNISVKFQYDVSNIDLSDSSSENYTQLREAFESLISSSLKETMTDLHSVKVVQMRHGSLIVVASLVLWKIPDEEYIKKVYDGLVHLSEKKNNTVLNKSVEVISVIIQDKESMLKNETSTTEQMTRNISVKFQYDVSNIDLSDSSSENYTQLREAFESLISSSLKETMTDLHSVKVVQMRHGSLIVVASLVLWKIPDEEYIKKVYDGLVHLSEKKNNTVLNKSVEVISVIIQDKESMLKNETSTTEQMTRNISVKFQYDVSNIDLSDSSSENYTQLREAFESLISSSLKETMTDLHSVKVVQMRHGSLIVVASLVLWKIPDEEYIKKVYDGLVHLSEKKNNTVLNKSVEVISVIIQDKEILSNQTLCDIFSGAFCRNETSTTPTSTSRNTGDDTDLTLGLAIGIPLFVVFAVSIVAAVLIWKKKKRSSLFKNAYNSFEKEDIG
ncbi:hypothetical protein Btru_047369, partial [Bulinus truncatus]